MTNDSIQPRILLITPEISLVPDRSGENSGYLNFRSDGFVGFLSHWLDDLYAWGADVHIAQPNYRSVFAHIWRENPRLKECRLPQSHVHLTEDRAFFYSGHLQSNSVWENIKISLAFQREVINQVLPLLKPDLIHCHDWMCGLIPAVARKLEIPCIFTIQSCETAKCLLLDVEDVGIDGAVFWQQLFFDRFPINYEETRQTNAVDFLLSGIFAAHHVSIASSAILVKIAESLVRFPAAPLGRLLSEKRALDCHTATEVHAVEMQYIDLYERLLRRPLLKTDLKKSKRRNQFFGHLNRLELFETGRARFLAAT